MSCPAGPASSTSPTLLAKSLSLEPSCSPCGHQGALDADAPLQPDSGSEEGAEPAESGGSVNDTGPPELPVTTVTAPNRTRPPLPGPKPQGKL